MHENENNDNEVVMLGSVDSPMNKSEDTAAPISDNTENHSKKNEADAEVDVIIDSCEPSETEQTKQPVSNNDTEIVIKSLESLTEKVEHMNKLFEQKIAHTTHEEKIVDQMHAELQKYKQDMYSQLVRPILMDIIEIRDSILRISASYDLKPENEQSIPLKMFRDYAYDVQDILEKNNIIIYDGIEGETFNPIKQKAIKKVNTPVEELHGKIAESLSSGYEYLGKPISPEKVAVYFYQKPEETEEA